MSLCEDGSDIHTMTSQHLTAEQDISGVDSATDVTRPGGPTRRRFRICVVIPAFNEAGSVARVIATPAARPFPTPHVVVVNDGSDDDTAVRALRAGATVITLPVNLGIGGAVQAGYLYALRHGFDIAIQVDGDDQHDPAEIERLLDPIRDRSGRDDGGVAVARARRLRGAGGSSDRHAPAGRPGPLADRRHLHRHHVGLSRRRRPGHRPVRPDLPHRLPRGRVTGPGQPQRIAGARRCRSG